MVRGSASRGSAHCPVRPHPVVSQLGEGEPGRVARHARPPRLADSGQHPRKPQNSHRGAIQRPDQGAAAAPAAAASAIAAIWHRGGRQSHRIRARNHRARDHPRPPKTRPHRPPLAPDRPSIAGNGNKGLFTSTNPELRRVVPDDVAGRVKVKVVYTVLEAQYQSALSSGERAGCGRAGADLGGGWDGRVVGEGQCSQPLALGGCEWRSGGLNGSPDHNSP
jgi:hypothetical protein